MEAEPRTQAEKPTAATTEPISIGGTNGATTTTTKTSEDPFSAMRSEGDDPFSNQRTTTTATGETADVPPTGAAENDTVADLGASPPVSAGLSPPTDRADRRMSREWDASKVPPSQFQKRKGSIYATPGSRDGHVEKNDQVAYKEKLKEKGWGSVKKVLGKK